MAPAPQLLNLPPGSPAEKLAADEALLDHAEAGHNTELLYFWEPSEPFVVVGYANKLATEVNLAACAEKNIPVLRRCSGGGAVVQLPGGLNYTLILRITEDGPTRNISAANQFIMEKNRQAIQSLVGSGGSVSVRGHTDLALSAAPDAPARKFSGNSQRRRRQFLLFHGTLLLDCDLALISEFLPMPSLQPDYRARRPHADFVTNLNLPVADVQAAFIREWRARDSGLRAPRAEIEKLAREKYTSHAWNRKF